LSKLKRKRTLNIAGVQIQSADNISASLDKALHYIQKASNNNVDFILFPEMYLTGYNNEFDSSEVEKALAQIAQAAKRHKINILMGTGSRHLGVAVNQVRIFSKKGNLAGIYTL